MVWYAIFIPDEKLGIRRDVVHDKKAALCLLKTHKEARMKVFASFAEVESFYASGSLEQFVKVTPPSVSSPSSMEMQSLCITPTSQMLVGFRKLIESNNVSEVRTTICQNPRYLVSHGNTPPILKAGPRYNALHIAAIEGHGEICRLILQTVEDTAYIEKLYGQRTSSTDDFSGILLDLYLNMPDKCRSETPLHFAAKHGSIDVVRELIAYPQCQVAPNAYGLLPCDIICTRAKADNDTAEVRNAIGALLVERYFVPLLRYEENIVPPIVGEPFCHNPPVRLDDPRSPPISPRRDIKAYAGPMDYNKAHRFYRRWKTPPRLVVVSPRSGELRTHHSSTPIKRDRRPRQLLSDDLALDLDRCDEFACCSKNELEDDDKMGKTPDSTESFTELKEKSLLAYDNQNPPSPVVESTPKRMFHDYRSTAGDVDTSINGSCLERSFSFLCDETQILYDHSQLIESPSYKERSIRLTDIEKGLETLGRVLATDERVGWKEYWNFLGKFCDLTSKDGLRLFEEYLLERETATMPVDQAAKEPAYTNDSIGMLCDEMTRWNIRGSPESTTLQTGPRQRNTIQHTQLSNLYLRVTSSLKVLASRFVTHLGHDSDIALTDFNQPPFLDIVQKLDTLVQDFRVDAAFHEIDFSKAHQMFAYLIVARLHDEAVIERVARTDKSRIQPAVQTTPETGSIVQCIKQSLLTFMQIRPILEVANTIDFDCQHLWESDILITSCSCRPKIGTSSAKRTKKLKRRRKQPAKRLNMGDSYLDTPNRKPDVVDYLTNHDSSGTSALAPKTSISASKEFSEDEDLYFNCSDTIGKKEPDKGKEVTTTLVDAMKDNEECRQVFIEGPKVSKQDLDVWVVLKPIQIDEYEFPRVVAWKNAMREHVER